MATRTSGSPAEVASGSPRDRLRRQAVRAWWWGKAHSYLDLARGPESCVLLLGSARSGTTWLGELIDRHHDHRVIFEPFRSGAVPGLEVLDGIRYLPPGTTSEEYVEPVRRLLSGGLRNGWTDHTSRSRLPRRRLLKEVRVNTLSPWLAAQFPQAPLLLLVRHPLAVVGSRRHLGWQEHLSAYLSDPRLCGLLSTEQEQTLRDLERPSARALGQWALETWVPLHRLPSEAARVVLYEELRDRPGEVGEQVLQWTGQRPDDMFLRVVDRPSRTSRPDASSRATRGDPGSLDRHERSEARRILEAFGLDALYDVDEPRPEAAGLRRWGHVVL